MGVIALGLSMMFSSIIIGLGWAWLMLTGYWWIVPILFILIGVPTAYIVAKWPHWKRERAIRNDSIEFDFTGLSQNQREYYEALLEMKEAKDRKGLLALQRTMERRKITGTGPVKIWTDGL